MFKLKKSKFALDIPIERGGDRFRAIYQTLTRGFVLLPEEFWTSVLAESELVDAETVDILRAQGFLVREEVDEREVFEIWRQQYVHDFSIIKSKVLVTRKCNNRCRYCIVDAEAKDMSRETARAVDRFYIDVIKERNPRRVEDDYSGGEALLNPAVVLESAGRRFHFCMGKGIEYAFSMTTNGTLLRPSTISKMKEVGLRGIRVSMAGPARIHDRLRPSKGEGKTYDIIMNNLQAISGLTSITIECQYDSHSQDYLAITEMMDDFPKRGIAVDTIAFTPILSKRGDFPFQGGMGAPEKLLFLMEEAQQRGYPQFDEVASNACMADFRCRFVFDTDGSILPCPALQSGEMVYGSVFKGVDFVAQAQLLSRKLPERCLQECEILPVCMGGCRLQSLTREKDFSGVDCHRETIGLMLEEYIKRKASEALRANDQNPGSREAA